MKLYRNIKLSTKALLINRSRTMFSILGMAVGITAVIVTVAIGEGAKQKALKPIKAMGTNVLLVNSGKVKTVFGRKKQNLNVTTLKLIDVDVLSEIEGIEYISPFQEFRNFILSFFILRTRAFISFFIFAHVFDYGNWIFVVFKTYVREIWGSNKKNSQKTGYYPLFGII